MLKRHPLILRAAMFAILFLAAVIIGYRILRPSSELPIYHPSQIDPRLVDKGVPNGPGEHHILDFDLIDQNGDHVSLATTKGKVLLTDFFFTTCGSICPKMSTQLVRVQEAFHNDDRVMLLSHSVTPELDTVPVLAAYAERYGVDARRWRLLTGERKQIYALARKSYFAVKDNGGKGDMSDFVHTENFVLVDPQLRIRGFYDGTSPKEVDRAIADMRTLLGERTH